MEILQKIALTITIIGGLNWGLIGLFNFNLVNALFHNFDKIIYIIVGICSLINIGLLFISYEK